MLPSLARKSASTAASLSQVHELPPTVRDKVKGSIEVRPAPAQSRPTRVERRARAQGMLATLPEEFRTFLHERAARLQHALPEEAPRLAPRAPRHSSDGRPTAPGSAGAREDQEGPGRPVRAGGPAPPQAHVPRVPSPLSPEGRAPG